MSNDYHCQVAIVGGGIAGLWLLNALTAEGYRAVLLERHSLGCTQTLASQGMIHGGIKYALGGFTTPSSESIASMPERWNAAIRGEGQVDLSGVRILSDDYYLFSDDSLSSKVTAFFGSKAIRGRVETLRPEDLPACFQDPGFQGRVYRLQDLVLDTASLVSTLATRCADRVLKSRAGVIADASGNVHALSLGSDRLTADAYIFCAGAGNAELIEELALSSIGMQRRPLHQVMVKAEGLPQIYAHAVSARAGAKPRVTFTTHHTSDGSRIWYLGGNLAETGVKRGEMEQLEFARREMLDLFPWIDWQRAEWRSFRIDRAEPQQADHGRPDSPFCQRGGNAILCWPTKLSLAPLLADEAIKELASMKFTEREESLPSLPMPEVGKAPWDLAY